LLMRGVAMSRPTRSKSPGSATYKDPYQQLIK
jgi:hypothetical protein